VFFDGNMRALDGVQVLKIKKIKIKIKINTCRYNYCQRQLQEHTH
jgi:hypothetical protein